MWSAKPGPSRYCPKSHLQRHHPQRNNASPTAHRRQHTHTYTIHPFTNKNRVGLARNSPLVDNCNFRQIVCAGRRHEKKKSDIFGVGRCASPGSRVSVGLQALNFFRISASTQPIKGFQYPRRPSNLATHFGRMLRFFFRDFSEARLKPLLSGGPFYPDEKHITPLQQ